MNHKRKILLIIFDGFGLSASTKGNAVALAGMDFFNSLIAKNPSAALSAAGLEVGLPWRSFGNSEVGHSAMGTGRVLIQDWARINKEIQNEDFFKNEAFLGAIEHCKKFNSDLHISGCFSPGGIHSHEDHLFALLELCKRQNFNRVFLHLWTDGEDSDKTESLESLKRLEPFLKKSNAKIASIMGRTYSMDRVLNWKLTESAWMAMTEGGAPNKISADEIADYISNSHKSGKMDDEIPPAVITEMGLPVGTIKDNDSIIFFNFRNDRMKQILATFALEKFDYFDRGTMIKNLFITTMKRYTEKIPIQAVAYEALLIQNTLGDLLSNAGLKQTRIAEKEKEAHVTSFFNGGRLTPSDGERWIIASSRPFSNSELILHPEMSAPKIVETVKEEVAKDASVIVVNFANSDMLAHTGNLDATISALNILDDSLREIMKNVALLKEYFTIITCDHGNSEELIDPMTGGIDTQHSTSNVPIVIIGDGFAHKDGSGAKNLKELADQNPIGSLFDIAPTALKIIGIEQPKEMTGSPLFIKQ